MVKTATLAVTALAATSLLAAGGVDAQGSFGTKGDGNDIYVGWTVAGDTITFEMEGASNNYVAFGLDNGGAYHQAMDVFACVGTGVDGGPVTAVDYYSSSSSAPPTDAVSALTLTTGTAADGRISCTFTRPLAGGPGKATATPPLDHDLSTGTFSASYALGAPGVTNWEFHSGGDGIFPDPFQAVTAAATPTPTTPTTPPTTSTVDVCRAIQCDITEIKSLRCYQGATCAASECCVPQPPPEPDECNRLACEQCLAAQESDGCHFCHDKIMGGSGCMKGLTQKTCHTEVVGSDKQWKVYVVPEQCPDNRGDADAFGGNSNSDGNSGGGAATTTTTVAMAVTVAASTLALLL